MDVSVVFTWGVCFFHLILMVFFLMNYFSPKFTETLRNGKTELFIDIRVIKDDNRVIKDDSIVIKEDNIVIKDDNRVIKDDNRVIKEDNRDCHL
jgi:lipopolysaccharide assembly outer membrane protein LptD (OstA)